MNLTRVISLGSRPYEKIERNLEGARTQQLSLYRSGGHVISWLACRRYALPAHSQTSTLCTQELSRL